MRSFILLLSLISCLVPDQLQAQGFGEYLGDESILYSETKQVNQFFRRFNGEEDPEGKRLYQQDSLFHSNSLRTFYLSMLFDQSSATMADADQERFNGEMIGQQRYLDFHGGSWVAEVNCTFMYQGVARPVILFLVLEEANVGSKWVFKDVFFAPYKQRLTPGQSEASLPFLHPLSHELDFMNLNKVFREPEQASQFTAAEYRPDFLTLFLYELSEGKFTFRNVNEVKFHFFQIDGWYFQLSDIQRQDPNRGWLITQLLSVPSGQEQKLLDFIYRR